PVDLGHFSPPGLIAGDFNGDGLPDLALTSGGALLPGPGAAGVEVLTGLGGGAFLPPVPSTLPAAGGRMVPAAFNGDGRTDLALLNGGGTGAGVSAVNVALSLGDGRFAAPGAVAASVRDTPVLADPGDGTLDVFIVDQSGAILWRKGQTPSDGV